MDDNYRRDEEIRRLKAEMNRLWADLRVVSEQLQSMGRREFASAQGRYGRQFDDLQRVRDQAEDLRRRYGPRFEQVKREAQDLFERFRQAGLDPDRGQGFEGARRKDDANRSGLGGLGTAAALGLAVVALQILKRR